MAATRVRLDKQLQVSTTPGSVIGSNTSNEAGWIAPTTGADRILAYISGSTATQFVTVGTNLSITAGVLNASAGAGGYSTIQEEGSSLTARSTMNFIGGGITATDNGGATRTDITLASQLNTFAAYNTNGLFTQTAAGTYTGRTITGTASRITVTNGDGVAGNPTIDINTSYVGQSSITTLGTITTGVWTGTAIAAINGGTGLTTYTTGDTIYASATNTLSKLGIGANGTFLKSNGTIPGWSSIASTDLSNSANIGLLNATQTWSGANTFSNNITMNGTPSANTDVVTVGYVNNLLTGLDPKGSVRVATTAILTASAQTSTTITLGGTTLTIDSISLANGDRVLVKDSVTGGSGGTFNNGIYTVGGIGSSVVLTRSTDMDAWTEVPAAITFVEVGTTNADTGWLSTADQGGTLGTTAITFVKFAGVGAGVTSVNIAVPTGMGVSGGPITTSGTITLSLANDLLALEGLASTGIAVRTATDTWAQRTLTGTAARISISNGDGVAGNPTVDIDATYAGQTSIVTLGTVATGTWNATTIAVNKGGTGLTAGTSGGILYYSATGTLASSGALTDNVIVVGGGAGVTPNSIAAGLGTTTTVLHGNAAGEPTWGAVALATDVSGTLSAANGGTGQGGGYTAGDILVATGSTILAKLPVGSNGQVLKVVSGSPTWSTDATGSTTVTRAYLTGSTLTTVDLDTGTSVTDVDGTNTSMTLPADLNNFFVYRNGVLLSKSAASSPVRDYSLNTGTNEITFVTALTADESVLFVKFA